MEGTRLPDEEEKRNYSDLKVRLETAINKVNKTTDLREAKGLLIEVQGRFKGLKLQREQREELYTKLQGAFDKINMTITEERESFENEAQLTYFNLKTQVEEAQFLASNPKDLKETWNFLVEVQSQFKGARLLREHREELYSRLQACFEKVKGLQNEERSGFEKLAVQNFPELEETIEDAVSFAKISDDFRAAKERLIQVQDLFRETKLLKEQRDELYIKLQDGFTYLKIRQEENAEKFDVQAGEHFSRLLPQIKELALMAGTTTEFRPVREKLKELQSEMKDLSLKREHRDELYHVLQDAFDTLSLRQGDANDSFEKEAKQNYERLKVLVDQGLTQAEKTHQYKETREFLKMIQSEFRGIKLIREQREELYSRLQTAFDILGKRLDEYFREKKKNWAVKMEYKLSEYNSDIYGLEDSLKKDREELSEMEDQLEIMIAADREDDAIAGLRARISSAKISIERKENQYQRLISEKNDLKNKLDPEDET